MLRRTQNGVITIRDVAEAAGVSKTTAVFVLNDAPHFKIPDSTRQRVHDAATRLGYRRNGVAAALSSGRIHTIGVVVPYYEASPDHSSFGLVYAKDVLIAITNAARKINLRVTLIPYDDVVSARENELIDGRVDGVILVSPRNPEFTERLFNTGFPCVSIGSDETIRPIQIDNRGGARQAVEHLVELGHRRIGCRTGDAESTVTQNRREGFLEAITEKNLDSGLCPLLPDMPAVIAALEADSVSRPTAIVAYNDWRAFEIVEQARQMGISVPQELSIVGFDNNILAETCNPPLTTILNPLEQIADGAIAVLQALLNGEVDVPLPAPFPTSLILRKSTAPPPVA